jgi:hypothetical protein
MTPKHQATDMEIAKDQLFQPECLLNISATKYVTRLDIWKQYLLD